MERDEVMPPPIPHPPSERVNFPKGLPWAPKVRYGVGLRETSRRPFATD